MVKFHEVYCITSKPFVHAISIKTWAKKTLNQHYWIELILCWMLEVKTYVALFYNNK